MSKRAWVVVIILLCAAAIGYGVWRSARRGPPGPPETITIGAVLPLTGSAADFGNWMRQGLELAVEDIRQRGVLRGQQVSLSVEDSQGDPKTGVSAFRKLSDVGGVHYVFTSISGVTMAILPVATQAGVLVITSSTHPEITSGKYLALRNYLTPIQEATTMARFAYSSLGRRRVGVIYLNELSLRGYQEWFRKSFEKLGGSVQAESYEAAATDFRLQLTKLKAFRPDALYIAGWKEVGAIMKQAVELGLRIPFLGCITFDSPKTVEMAGPAAEGAIFTVPAYETGSRTPAASAFRAKYKAKFGSDPDVNVAIYYDSLMWLAETLARVGDNPAEVRRAMIRSSHEGVMGSLRFTENGDILMPIQLMTIRQGRFTPYGSR
jgi:branched-chain amino acid transport system substrate-binding protein